MTSTTRDADTALLCGADNVPQVGHFYVDIAKGRLHCLNDVARQLRARGLAHDLRSPLQPLGLVRHILEFRTLAESQRQEALTRLSSAAERAQKMAQELLDWCRNRGSSRATAQRDWFALEPFLREALAEQ